MDSVLHQWFRTRGFLFWEIFAEKTKSHLQKQVHIENTLRTFFFFLSPNGPKFEMFVGGFEPENGQDFAIFKVLCALS